MFTWLTLLRAFIIHLESHKPSIAPFYAKGPRGLQGAALFVGQWRKGPLIRESDISPKGTGGSDSPVKEQCVHNDKAMACNI